MSRYMVQPRIPPSTPSLPTCSWRSLRSKPLAMPPPAHIWLRFVDDTNVILKAENSASLLQHINTQDPHMQFTIEEPNQQGSLPFLDTQVSPGPNNTPITTVYRKPTCTDQCLHWDSNHYIEAKHSVYNTLAHRSKIVSHDQQALHQELDQIRAGLQACHFPTWALNRLQQSFEQHHQTSTVSNSRANQPTTNTNSNNTSRNIYVMVPYIQGLRQKFQNIHRSRSIQVHLRGTNTVKTLLMAPQRQGPQIAEKWHHLKLQMPTHKLH